MRPNFFKKIVAKSFFKNILALSLGTFVSLILLESFSFLYLKINLNLKIDERAAKYQGDPWANWKSSSEVDYISSNRWPHPIYGFSIDFPNSAEECLRRFPYDSIQLQERYDLFLGKRTKQENVFAIGIFGASVASSFFSEMSKTSVLVNELKKRLPFLKNKEIRLYNYSVPSSKQPQQMGLFHTFIDLLDMAINIDGFNEIDNDNYPRYPLEWPLQSWAIYSFKQDLTIYTDDLQLYRIVSRKLSQWGREFSYLSQSPFYFLFWTTAQKLLYHETYKTMKKAENQKNEKSANFYYRHPLKSEEVIKVNARLWGKYTFLQNALAQSKHIRSYFFIQPNQYVQTQRKFTSWEKENAFLRGQDFKQKINAGYSILRKEGQELKKQGVSVLDLSFIYDKTAGPVYIDDCCHVNSIGNQLMAKAIIDFIVRSELGQEK